MATRLAIIIASTRPGRVGLPVGEWTRDRAVAHGGFDVDLIDLKELALPFLDEPNHPRFQDYVHDHTKAWGARIDAADAFVFVTPEYNYGYTAPLKNAVDYLHHEWAFKPVGLVSYGGVAGGTRAVQLIKPVLSALRMVPLTEGVPIPWVGTLVKDGVFTASDPLVAGADAMFDALRSWSETLAALRNHATR